MADLTICPEIKLHFFFRWNTYGDVIDFQSGEAVYDRSPSGVYKFMADLKELVKKFVFIGTKNNTVKHFDMIERIILDKYADSMPSLLQQVRSQGANYIPT